jgi:predicted XRE-type DNA-binding protein
VTGARVVTGELHRVQRGRRKGFVPEAPSAPVRQPARVAVMLALAHQIQRAIDRGELKDQADAARRLGVTRARLTQLLDLTLLASDLQERVLSLQLAGGAEPLSERALRPVGRTSVWGEQRTIFESPTR